MRGINVKRAGSAILPINQLTQILRESTDEEISLDATAEGTRGQVRHQPLRDARRGRWTSSRISPTFDDDGRYHEITAGVLRTMISRTAFAADKKDSASRFALKGVLWEAEGKNGAAGRHRHQAPGAVRGAGDGPRPGRQGRR